VFLSCFSVIDLDFGDKKMNSECKETSCVFAAESITLIDPVKAPTPKPRTASTSGLPASSPGPAQTVKAAGRPTAIPPSSTGLQIGPPMSFMGAVRRYATEHKCSRGEAVRKCEQIYPGLHRLLREGSPQV
jgi:hypothetical protein